MLTTETKRHIDAARQVLVGVVPNPSSQIDQITNALIYKFMDDMDQMSIKAGGKPAFFTGDLERYAWTRLMDSRVGNQERMNIYTEALIKFSESKQLPELFRSIFKSAFLPYRSPEVLGLFLKEIDYFDYSHSEELGNAYEYLLSIMGSQGDAGQFRTPRHIINFIVAAVDPTKDDKVLDPACGTAGFLVSAYRHILEQHDDNEKPLTPDQRRALTNNFEGYDVDPGMVRISQVNMYLHQFKTPKIYNYNTLSDDERWSDKFDVIMANPPFMSPKGGVSTHNKFSIESTRSEVLFVDYIINHLRPKGRAGIIVPEGIIFQSGTAHKQLRKNLLADGLYAVVSLPSGVFQPYSGVKTSILLFNNELAKRSSDILFVKIQNDGFDLGATKRPIDKNDLPVALRILNEYKKSSVIASGAKQSPSRHPREGGDLAHTVEKTKISATGDYNLSGDRYRVATDYTNAKWPMVELGDIADFKQGKQVDKDLHISEPKSGYSRFIRIVDYTQENGDVRYIPTPSGDVFCNEKELIMVRYGRPGLVGRGIKGVFANNLFKIDFLANHNIDLDFAYYLLNSDIVQSYIKNNLQTSGLPAINHSIVKKIRIPLPPLEIQEQLVAELDGYQKIISGARRVVENWKPKIDINPKWEKVKMGDLCELHNGKAFKPSDWEKKESGGLPIIRIQNLNNEQSEYNYFTGKIDNQIIINNGDLLFSWSGSRGTSFGPHIWKGQKAILNQHIFKVVHKDNILKDFFCLMLRDAVKEVEENLHGGVGLVHITKGNLERITIPVPSLETQKQIVAQIESERALVESNKKLIEIYEQKTKDCIAKVWGD